MDATRDAPHLGFDEPAQLLELNVERYKNLRSMRVDWSGRLVLYGPNGSGKTNLLEAMALCLGSEATLWQVAPRAEVPVPGAISVVLRAGDAELPAPPRYCIQEGVEPNAATGHDPVSGAARFWSLLGITNGAAGSWPEAVTASVDHPALVQLLIEAGTRPTVRYGLERIEGLTRAADARRGENFRNQNEYRNGVPDLQATRRFSRTLVGSGDPPNWLIEAAQHLPDAFGPLRRWLDAPPPARGPFYDLLELPAARWAPATVVWLPSDRSTSEAWVDLDMAFDRAEPAAFGAAVELDRMRVISAIAPDEDDAPDARNEADARFWLVAEAARRVTNHVGRIFPTLSAQAEDAHVGSITIYREVSGRQVPLGELQDSNLFDRLSSGERTWMDIGFAHASAALDDLSVAATWIERAVATLDDEALLVATVELQHLSVFRDDYWYPDDLTEALEFVQRRLGASSEALLGSFDDRATQRIVEALMSSSLPLLRAAFQRTLTIHLYDEPERHLHPAAQRQVQGQLNELTEANVAIATHSHLFLGGPDWQHLHLDPTPDGPTATPFRADQLELANAVTRQMGLHRGELLARFQYVLFVEGAVDVIVLRGLFGDHLDASGILVLPIYGVDEVLSLAELHLFGQIVDIGAGLMVDHAKTERLTGPPPKHMTKEEQALRDLAKRLRSRGRRLDLYGLEQEDIVAYLDGGAIQRVAPDFPGWEKVSAGRRSGETFKAAVERMAHIRVRRNLVRKVVEEMQHDGSPARLDLPGTVEQILRAAQATGG